MPCHFVYALKLDKHGNVARYKARLVADGNRQTPDMYSATFAAVPTHTSFRLFMAMATANDWEVDHWDIKTAFLHADIDTEIYIKPPPGYVFQDPKCDYLQVLKSLYGLRQAMRLFLADLDAFLKSSGFIKLDSESCIYARYSAEGVITMLILVYVDDIIVACAFQAAIDALFAQAKAKYDINTLGAINFYLGMEVIRNRKSAQPSCDRRPTWTALPRTMAWSGRSVATTLCRCVPIRNCGNRRQKSFWGRQRKTRTRYVTSTTRASLDPSST